VFSDLGNNRLYSWDELTGQTTVFRNPANHTNGTCQDRQGRLISCEQQNRRVVRTEHDGSITVIADRFNGKLLNSPNDVVVKSDGTIWFTDPPNGITDDYEGRRAQQEQEGTNVYRVDPQTGAITVAIGDIRPNRLCFNHDETKFYVTRSQAQPTRVMVYDVVQNGTRPANGKAFIEHASSRADGIKCDWQGNLWCSWGAGAGESGVRVFAAADAKPLLQIDLPERAANLYFGGPVGNRLFMTAQQSLYAIYVGTRGAKLTD
jgi:gluconolactonase